MVDLDLFKGHVPISVVELVPASDLIEESLNIANASSDLVR